MKSLEEIKNIGIEELEAIAGDERIKVPEGFEKDCALLIDILDKTAKLLKEDDGAHKKLVKTKLLMKRLGIAGGIAAAVAIVSFFGLSLYDRYSEPEDTFSDPRLAYAEVQKALDRISENMNKGAEGVSVSREILERPVEIINKNKK